MLGGYQILDLRKIDLSHGTSEASITDADVLNQLLNIRDHIQKTYDFSKPLHNQLKPLLIRYRDKKVGEKHEVALYGNIEVINVYYKFRIIANNEGEQLTINVEFEEKTDEYDNKYWDIKTAKVLLTSAETTIANILAGGNVDNAKPIYFHPIVFWGGSSTDYKGSSMSLVILDNNSTPYTISSFIEWLETNHITYLAPVSGSVYYNGRRYIVSWIDIGFDSDGKVDYLDVRCQGVDEDLYLQEVYLSRSVILNNFSIDDGINKIN